MSSLYHSKVKRSTQNKAVMFLSCLSHGPYLGEAKVSTVISDLTNFVDVNVFMKTINYVFLTGFSYTLFTKTLLLFHISLLKRFIYRRVNTSKILHNATIPVTLTKNQVKTMSVHFFIKKKLPSSRSYLLLPVCTASYIY